MISHWLKPNTVGIAFFAILALSILFIFDLFVMTPCHWLWRLGLYISLLAAYPISMVSGRRVETKRELKNGLAGKEFTTENRRLEWFSFIAFLVLIAIPLDLGCFLLAQASYPYLTPPPNIVPPRPIEHWPSYVLPIVLPIVLMILKWNTAFIIFLTAAIFLERFCAELAFHTIGEIASMFYYSAIWLNFIPIITTVPLRFWEIVVSQINSIGCEKK